MGNDQRGKEQRKQGRSYLEVDLGRSGHIAKRHKRADGRSDTQRNKAELGLTCKSLVNVFISWAFTE